MARKKDSYSSEVERSKSFEHCPAGIYKRLHSMSNEEYEEKYQEWRMPQQNHLTTNN